MKTKNQEVWKRLLVFVFIMQIIFVCCSDDDTTKPIQEAEAPEIPPQSSFIIDFSDFLLAENALKPLNNNEIQSFQNWGWSAGNIVVWNTLLTVTLAVPVASFLESFNHDPQLQPDGTWIWSYSFTVLEQQYNAELHAEIEIDGVQWNMYISRQNAYSKFHWYEGKSNLFTTDGTWTLYKNPNDPSPLLYIEWDRNILENTGNTKYANIIPDNPDNGSYIQYGITTQTPFDAFYTIYSVSKQNSTLIEWNRTTKDGRVNDQLHFGDSNWHCWNSNLADGECQ
jgi:hypothetical protein